MARRYILIAAIIILGCKKDTVRTVPFASLTVVNAITTGKPVKLNSNMNDSAASYNYKLFGLLAGNGRSIYLYPSGDSIHPYYTSNRQINTANIYTIFLSGQSPSIDTIFKRENIPPYYADSSIGVRVINLSPNSTPVVISLASSPTINEFGNIAYQQMTDFKKYPLLSIIPSGSISFQVRNSVTNGLLATYTLPVTAVSPYLGISIALSRNRNITLVIKGLVGITTGSDSFGIYPVANY